MEQLTEHDLDRIYFRTQDEEGRYVNVNAQEAADKQFNAWAHSRVPIQGGDGPWSPVERADFCNRLYQEGALHILKKDAIDETN